jgi:uncharacterized protein YggT (Ycf19 family)
MKPDRVAADESRRIAQHERIKHELEQDVHAHIAQEARASGPDQQAELGSVAADLKRRATAEVRESEAELARARGLGRVSQVLDYFFFLVYSLIGLEIGLELFGARQSSGFKQFLDSVTAPLLGPFRGLMPDPALGSLQLMMSYVVALLVYMLLHRALKKLLQLFASRQTSP